MLRPHDIEAGEILNQLAPGAFRDAGRGSQKEYGPAASGGESKNHGGEDVPIQVGGEAFTQKASPQEDPFAIVKYQVGIVQDLTMRRMLPRDIYSVYVLDCYPR